MQKLIAFLKSLFFGPEPKAVVLVTEEDANQVQQRNSGKRDHHQVGGQQDARSYWLVHEDGTTFAGTPAQFGRFEAERRGATELQVNRESVIVYLLKAKAAGKDGSRKGWKLQ